jgi:hypothetical protein
MNGAFNQKLYNSNAIEYSYKQYKRSHTQAKNNCYSFNSEINIRTCDMLIDIETYYA